MVYDGMYFKIFSQESIENVEEDTLCLPILVSHWLSQCSKQTSLKGLCASAARQTIALFYFVSHTKRSIPLCQQILKTLNALSLRESSSNNVYIPRDSHCVSEKFSYFSPIQHNIHIILYDQTVNMSEIFEKLAMNIGIWVALKIHELLIATLIFVARLRLHARRTIICGLLVALMFGLGFVFGKMQSTTKAAITIARETTGSIADGTPFELAPRKVTAVAATTITTTGFPLPTKAPAPTILVSQ